MLGAICALAAVAAVAYARRRRRRDHVGKAALAQSVAQNQHVPMTLHPVIDPDLCIGSLSCLTACPEGDILGVVDGRAVLINVSACIGHGSAARMSGGRDQAGLRHRRALRGAAGGGRGLRVQPQGRARGGRAGRDGFDQERAHPGHAVRGAPGQGALRQPRAGGHHRRGHRRRRAGGAGHRARVQAGGAELPAARAGERGRHGVPLPAAEGGDDRAGGAAPGGRASARRSSPRRRCWRRGSGSFPPSGCRWSRE